MSFWTNFWDIIWIFFWSFVFVAYLITLFSVIADLFRDHKLNGWWKAVWLICMVFVPFITVLVYVIARGRGMAERSQRQAVDAKSATDEYIRSVATHSPAEEIAKAQSLLSSGAITQQEFDALKAKALS